MANPSSSVRFDHREVAVIFSLFIFVSLLMFTVGIVVGKGLTQTRYESILAARTVAPPPSPVEWVASTAAAAPTGSSLTIGSNDGARSPAEATPAAPPEKPPLKLIPKSQGPVSLPADPNTKKEADKLALNPRIKPLLEGAKVAKKKPAPVEKTEEDEEDRATASNAPPAGPVPPSFAAGAYTVQVGSYPTKTDALDRITSLKQLGFPHAYLSVKKFGDGKEIWYRVWLGYYPDSEAAKKSGEYLQQRGEVNNYLIRKSDNPG